MKYRFLIVLIGLVLSASLMAQSGGVLIGQKPDSSPDASAILELFSTEKGLLIPRTTAASITEPAEGLLIFDTDSTQFLYFDGSEWMSLINKLEVSNANLELKLLIDSKIDSVTDLFLDLDKLQALQMDTIKSVIAESVAAQGLVNDSIFGELSVNSSNDTVQTLQIDSIKTIVLANLSSDTIQTLEIDTLNMILSEIDGDGLSSDTSVLKVNTSTGLTITDDTLRIVTGDSAQVMVTTGDGSNVEWVDREEIGKPLLAGSNMTVEDIDGKNIVSLQDTVSIETLVINNDSISSIATASEWGVVSLDDSTSASTVAYTHKALKEGGDEIDFVYGEKKITRAGLTGLTGTALNASNMEEFLKKVFFPVSTPYIYTLKYDDGTNAGESYQRVDIATKTVNSTVGLVSLPYSFWNGATDLALSFDVVNQSVKDDSEDTPISSIVLQKGATEVSSYAVTPADELADTIKGAFTVLVTDLDKSPTVETSNILSMTIADAYPNEQTLDFNVIVKKAIKASVSTVDAGATDVIYTGSDLAFDLKWTVNAGDETLTGLTVDGNAVTPVTSTQTSVNFNAVEDRQQYTVGVTGDIYATESTKSSGYKYWSFKCPYGYISLNGAAGATDADKINNTVTSLISDYTALETAIINGSGDDVLNFRSFNANYFTDGIGAQNNGYAINLNEAASGEKVFIVFLIPKRNAGAPTDWTFTVYNPLSGGYDSLSEYNVIQLDNYVGTESYYMVYSTFAKVNASGAEYYKLSKN